jgi:HAE1 family hydrophobic/amphiphilic exporter-1
VVRGLVATKFALAAMIVIYVRLLWATVWMLETVPRGFIPTLDQGYAIVVVQLPEGASLSRTDAVVRRASQIMEETPGVAHAGRLRRLLGATFTNATNAGVIFASFDSRSRSGCRTGCRRMPSSATCSAGCRRSRRRSSSPCRHRRSAASATPAASSLQIQERDTADVRRILEVANS